MFNYYQPTKIHFEEGGLAKLGEITKKYGTNVLLVTTSDEPLLPLFNRAKELLTNAGLCVQQFDKVQPNPSVEMVEEGFLFMQNKRIDVVVAVGGGSTIDTAKTLAFTNGLSTINWDELFTKFDSPYTDYDAYSKTSLPLISVPTTSGTGSQVTQAAVVTRGSEKITYFHPDLFSKECILDPELMLTLPKRITASTGFDAFTHAFESFINKSASIMSEIDSITAMKLVVEYLPKVLKEPNNMKYRSMMSAADTLAGRALANAGAAAPHPLSEIIGGITHLPHGEALAVVFPAFIKHAQTKSTAKFQQVQELFQAAGYHYDTFYETMVAFLKEIGLYKSLKDFDVSIEAMNEILSCPVLDHLPVYNRQELEAMLTDSFA